MKTEVLRPRGSGFLDQLAPDVGQVVEQAGIGADFFDDLAQRRGGYPWTALRGVGHDVGNRGAVDGQSDMLTGADRRNDSAVRLRSSRTETSRGIETP